MRCPAILPLWALVWPRISLAQEPIPVTYGQGLCKTILNAAACAHVVEARQIGLSHGRVRRDSAALYLRLTSGRTVTVVDDTASDRPTWFFYLGLCSALGYYVLSAEYDEGAAIRLVNARTGWSVEIVDLPIVSPDRRRFVTTNLAFERISDWERLQVWRVEGDTLRREWGLVPNYWVPEEVRWLSNRSFEFAHMEPGVIPNSATRAGVDTAEIDSTGQWTTRLGP